LIVSISTGTKFPSLLEERGVRGVRSLSPLLLEEKGARGMRSKCQKKV